MHCIPMQDPTVTVEHRLTRIVAAVRSAHVDLTELSFLEAITLLRHGEHT